MLSKKTISPVIATALLFVVAVSAVVGFQNFFKNANLDLKFILKYDFCSYLNCESVTNIVHIIFHYIIYNTIDNNNLINYFL